MATAVARLAPIRSSHTPPPLVSSHDFDVSKIGQAPVPNKHLQSLSPGCPPTRAPDTPPASPPTKHLTIQTSSILYPPDPASLVCQSPLVYSIDAPRLAAALDHISSQPLPEAKQVFPWLHGLHPENQVQLAFFVARRRSLRRTPRCLRGITIVKADGDLTRSKIKGALSPDEILDDVHRPDPAFLDPDPKDGFSVRNFHIQARKVATVSDIVVYGDDDADPLEIRAVAKQVAHAQMQWRRRSDPEDHDPPTFHTFVLSAPFAELERERPELITVNSTGYATGQVMDFFQWERFEMYSMSRATEIATNVWLGPTPASYLTDGDEAIKHGPDYDIFIETSDLAQVPTPQLLRGTAHLRHETDEAQWIDFPSSGSIMPPGWSETEIDAIVHTCHWIHGLANSVGEAGRTGNGHVSPATPRKFLLHCADGYTETSLLALAYYMFAEACSVHDAWLRLHCERQRNFFAYPSDVALLKRLQPRLLRESPKKADLTDVREPAWLRRMDGSLPSRILPYMYLGNLGHANNPGLLGALGIRRILSVGEPIAWPAGEEERWGEENLYSIDHVQDNGVDPLTNDFARCLDFISMSGLCDRGSSLIAASRLRTSARNGDVGSLSSRRFSIGNHLHRRGHEIHGHVLPTGLVSRSRMTIMSAADAWAAAALCGPGD